MKLRKLTEFGTARTVDVEGEIASATDATVGSQVSKDQTIVAEFLAEDEVFAFVVTVALEAVGEDTVLLRTITISLLSVDYRGRMVRKGKQK